MSDETNDITTMGDESEITDRETAFLPDRQIAPTAPPPSELTEDEKEAVREQGFFPNRQAEEAALEDPASTEPPAEEAKPDPMADLAADQERLLDSFDLPEAPEGWADNPQNWEDIEGNRNILNGLLGVGQLSNADRQEVVQDALARFEAGEASGPELAKELASYDPKASEAFVAAWRATEDSPWATTAEDYIASQAKTAQMLATAQAYAAEVEQAKEQEAAATEAFETGLAAFKQGLADEDKPFEPKAYELFQRSVSSPSFDQSAELSGQDITRLLRYSLGAAKHLDNAQASAQISAEFDALDPAPGYLGNEDTRKPYEAHLQDEIQRRIASGEMAQTPLTHSEKVAAVHDEFDAAEAGKWEGWNGRLAPATPQPAPEIEVDDLLDTPLERAQRAGWNVGKPTSGR